MPPSRARSPRPPRANRLRAGECMCACVRVFVCGVWGCWGGWGQGAWCGEGNQENLSKESVWLQPGGLVLRTWGRGSPLPRVTPRAGPRTRRRPPGCSLGTHDNTKQTAVRACRFHRARRIIFTRTPFWRRKGMEGVERLVRSGGCRCVCVCVCRGCVGVWGALIWSDLAP